MKIRTIIASLFLTVASLTAQATSIDFRNLPSGTAVSNQYPDFVASLSGGNASGAPTIAYYSSAGGYGGLSNTPTAGFYPTAAFLNINFTHAVDALSFNFDNEGYNGFNAWFTYDANHNLLETGALNTYSLITATQFGNGGVSLVQFGNGNGMPGSWVSDWTQALSVLNYNVAPVSDVPEPTSLLLIGAGIAGLAAARRRRKSA